MQTRNKQSSGGSSCEESEAQADQQGVAIASETPCWRRHRLLGIDPLPEPGSAEWEALRELLASARTRGWRETECRVELSTGEARCLHPRHAPKRLDCREYWCPHREEMTTRLLDRAKRALSKNRSEGQ